MGSHLQVDEKMIKGFSEVYWFMVYCFIRIYINYRLSSALSCVPWIDTGWQRPIGYLIFTGHFLPKKPRISGSFAENELQLKASCASTSLCTSSMRVKVTHGSGWNDFTLCLSRAHMAEHCNTLQYTATHCNTLQHTGREDETTSLCACWGHTWQHTALHCNTLQYTATHWQEDATTAHDRADEQTSAPICDCCAHHIYIYI